jgi:hypothetical protein
LLLRPCSCSRGRKQHVLLRLSRTCTDVRRMFGTLCLRYTQHELAWAFILYAARVLGCTSQLFSPAGVPLWREAGHVYDFPRLDSARLAVGILNPCSSGGHLLFSHAVFCLLKCVISCTGSDACMYMQHVAFGFIEGCIDYKRSECRCRVRSGRHVCCCTGSDRRCKRASRGASRAASAFHGSESPAACGTDCRACRPGYGTRC